MAWERLDHIEIVEGNYIQKNIGVCTEIKFIVLHTLVKFTDVRLLHQTYLLLLDEIKAKYFSDI